MNTVVINKIESDNLTLECNEPIIIHYYIKDDYLLFDDDELDIYLCCKNEKQLIDEFCDFIICDYMAFAKAEPDLLTDKAKEYGKLLQSKFTECKNEVMMNDN